MIGTTNYRNATEIAGLAARVLKLAIPGATPPGAAPSASDHEHEERRRDHGYAFVPVDDRPAGDDAGPR